MTFHICWNTCDEFTFVTFYTLSGQVPHFQQQTIPLTQARSSFERITTEMKRAIQWSPTQVGSGIKKDTWNYLKLNNWKSEKWHKIYQIIWLTYNDQVSSLPLLCRDYPNFYIIIKSIHFHRYIWNQLNTNPSLTGHVFRLKQNKKKYGRVSLRNETRYKNGHCRVNNKIV